MDTGASRTAIDHDLACEIGAGPIVDQADFRSTTSSSETRLIVAVVIELTGRAHHVEASVTDRSGLSTAVRLGQDDVNAPWCGREEYEAEIKDEVHAEVAMVPFGDRQRRYRRQPGLRRLRENGTRDGLLRPVVLRLAQCSPSRQSVNRVLSLIIHHRDEPYRKPISNIHMSGSEP